MREAVLRVGLCQVRTEAWALEGNARRTLAAVEQAAREGADVAVTPECVLHGYPDSTREAYVDGAPFEALEGYRERVREVAEALDGPRIRAFRTLAADLAMHVILGFAERADDGRLYNAAAWIARDGQITHVYRKVHLRPFEDAANGRGCFNP